MLPHLKQGKDTDSRRYYDINNDEDNVHDREVSLLSRMLDLKCRLSKREVESSDYPYTRKELDTDGTEKRRRIDLDTTSSNDLDIVYLQGEEMRRRDDNGHASSQGEVSSSKREGGETTESPIEEKKRKKRIVPVMTHIDSIAGNSSTSNGAISTKEGSEELEVLPLRSPMEEEDFEMMEDVDDDNNRGNDVIQEHFDDIPEMGIKTASWEHEDERALSRRDNLFLMRLDLSIIRHLREFNPLQTSSAQVLQKRKWNEAEKKIIETERKNQIAFEPKDIISNPNEDIRLDRRGIYSLLRCVEEIYIHKREFKPSKRLDILRKNVYAPKRLDASLGGRLLPNTCLTELEVDNQNRINLTLKEANMVYDVNVRECLYPYPYFKKGDKITSSNAMELLKRAIDRANDGGKRRDRVPDRFSMEFLTSFLFQNGDKVSSIYPMLLKDLRTKGLLDGNGFLVGRMNLWYPDAYDLLASLVHVFDEDGKVASNMLEYANLTLSYLVSDYRKKLSWPGALRNFNGLVHPLQAEIVARQKGTVYYAMYINAPLEKDKDRLMRIEDMDKRTQLSKGYDVQSVEVILELFSNIAITTRIDTEEYRLNMNERCMQFYILLGKYLDIIMEVASHEKTSQGGTRMNKIVKEVISPVVKQMYPGSLMFLISRSYWMQRYLYLMTPDILYKRFLSDRIDLEGEEERREILLSPEMVLACIDVARLTPSERVYAEGASIKNRKKLYHGVEFLKNRCCFRGEGSSDKEKNKAIEIMDMLDRAIKNPSYAEKYRLLEHNKQIEKVLERESSKLDEVMKTMEEDFKKEQSRNNGPLYEEEFKQEMEKLKMQSSICVKAEELYPIATYTIQLYLLKSMWIEMESTHLIRSISKDALRAEDDEKVIRIMRDALFPSLTKMLDRCKKYVDAVRLIREITEYIEGGYFSRQRSTLVAMNPLKEALRKLNWERIWTK